MVHVFRDQLISRYIVVGVWNTVFGIATFLLLSSLLFSWPNYLVLFLSYLISIVQSHFSQRFFVWESSKPYFSELIRFGTGYILQFIINVVLLEIGVKVFSLHRNSCQVFITITLLFFSFFLNKRYVFSRNSR